MKYRFSSCTELLSILESEGLGAPAYALKRECFSSGRSEDQVLTELDRRIAVTRAALIKGLSEPQRSRSGLTDGAAVRCAAASRRMVGSPYFARTLAYALAINEVNACGGKVVSFPTAGSSGIVPGALWAWWDTFAAPSAAIAAGCGDAEAARSSGPLAPPEPLDAPYDDRLRGAFLTAGLVGVLIAQGATLAGAEGGCQAECGAAGAMAAAALAYLEGLPIEESFSAAALALKNSLGLACDPVAGLVEVPCVKRNAFVAAAAVTAAELALAGIRSVVPFDEVVSAMKSIGDSLPASIKESAEGGLAVTPTGLYYKSKLSAEV